MMSLRLFIIGAVLAVIFAIAMIFLTDYVVGKGSKTGGCGP